VSYVRSASLSVKDSAESSWGAGFVPAVFTAFGAVFVVAALRAGAGFTALDFGVFVVVAADFLLAFFNAFFKREAVRSARAVAFS